MNESVTRIRVLPVQLRNRIAAGEVVERPASVVKELIENSLDAGAGRINVSVSGGGLASISVSDDGCGMGMKDLELAVEPHATSKLEDDDLNAIDTLGFRGEALASIASVSQVEMFSRPRDSEAGAAVKVHGGQKIGPVTRGGPPGTRVEVRNLFFNTPARKKHLRTQRTEMGRITAVVRELALAHPNTAFRLLREGEEILLTGGSGRLDQCLVELFGADVASEVMPFGEDDDVVRGFAGTPALGRSRRDRQYLLINGRSVSHPGVTAVLDRAYEGFLDRGRYPFVVVVVSLPPRRIDANVHPAKREVRIEDERELLGWIHELVRGALVGMPAPRWEMADGGGRRPSEGFTAGSSGGGRIGESQLSYLSGTAGEGDAVGSSGLFNLLEPLGQVERTYVAARGPEGLYLVDQHAACERLYYERALEAARRGDAPSQGLAMPQTCELDPEEQEMWDRYSDQLLALGFDVESFGGDTVLVRGVPVYADEPPSSEVLREVLREVSEVGASVPADEAVALATASCKAAVRAGDRLSITEIRHLFSELADLEEAGTCPHGRPTVVLISLGEIERMFHRR